MREAIDDGMALEAKTAAGSSRRPLLDCQSRGLWTIPQRPALRRRCKVTIEKPMPIRSRPAPTVQRRSKPVNGSELAFALVLGTLLAVADGVVFVGVDDDAGALAFDGDVPLLGLGTPWGP
jgi:hypothetical protein